jgi:primase-polymerase (primpol)-like protein
LPRYGYHNYENKNCLFDKNKKFTKKKQQQIKTKHSNMKQTNELIWEQHGLNAAPENTQLHRTICEAHSRVLNKTEGSKNFY